MLEVRRPDLSSFRNAGVPPDDMARIWYMIAAIGEDVTSSRRQFLISPMRGFNWAFILAPLKLYEREMLGEMVSIHDPHAQKQRKSGHAECTTKACIFNNIDENNYSNRHTTQTIIATSPGNNHLEITSPDAADTAYVAISHVWADGLGSTTEAGLPTCQLRRLSTLAHRLVTGGAFWIDGLDAAVVLVIDSGVYSCSINAPSEEKLLCVITSGWMQRLWTLQEAILARKLVFEFSDGIASWENLMPQGEDLLDVLKTNLAAEVYRLSKRRSAVEDGGELKKLNLGDVARSLRGRSTSKPEDETLAISGLLDVNASELVDLPSPERMVALLLRVRKIASDIIFLSVPKLERPGFRWAPKTPMISDGPTVGANSQDADCTSEGLLAIQEKFGISETLQTRDSSPFGILQQTVQLPMQQTNTLATLF
ncbi:hypothetical protein OBBRIDRAFT_833835 [Obba rivulosa]|uniref:Uncharacterized protein n=1 Tax=Obba rivulosa TaxID=1052685 RepID=A0A8E2AZD7_9APHY|nr:hypothetical protein OBBRIDRAFT_833835 [Obba rivulosa]